MAVLVEHDKRKKEILEKSLELFIEEGYEDVTFQKIADRCGITRTTLYIYFKNKREIFLWSVKQLITNLENQIKDIIVDKNENAPEALRSVLYAVLDKCDENTELFKVLLTYLIQVHKSGVDPNESVNRRVLRMRHFLSTIIIRGQKNGQIKKLPVKLLDEQLYGLVETAIFRIAVLDNKDMESAKALIDFNIDQISVQ